MKRAVKNGRGRLDRLVFFDKGEIVPFGAQRKNDLPLVLAEQSETKTNFIDKRLKKVL